MEKPANHIFICSSFRASGELKGKCSKKGASDLIPYIENEILDRGMDALLTSTGCMKQCDNGPVMVVYPQGHWYGNVESEEDIDEILDAIEEGDVAERLLIA
jgi:(2Fe-2S) ferredoxin